MPRRVGIVGTGLIGTSIGLALAAQGVEVLLRDTEDAQVTIAEKMGAGRRWAGERVEHAVVATPLPTIAWQVHELLLGGLADTVSDAGSVKARPVEDGVRLGGDLSSWCPAHPIAGRERHGAVSARPDLFAERVWAVCPLPQTVDAALAATTAVALACGATPVRTTPDRHDEAMATVSHVPQLLASVLAGELTGLDAHDVPLAGQGFRDTTRLADSDAVLWAGIIEGNREPIGRRVRSLGGALVALADVLETGDAAQVATAITALMRDGHAGRARLPRKAGATVREWGWVGVVLDDRPGQLAAIVGLISDWGVNIEDVGPFEHSLDAPAGIVELAVDPAVADEVVHRLVNTGWTAYRRS
ncbi:prephenate dehydrogenase/arogenate dehydrogenase family protein [Frankia sp. AgPm24]|uniref:prephenate dehydrogenase/arogenate dehydrogenase family protein n=1 Tax=Frankia sp. AgPm24 TaxID=631128 RepID=UPI00200EAE0A|nr:prephenate dehydrogenase/arogenate dehydrogenase family protein [Frankia sp. AgPm24]MCK9924479.1 prephenate dehydrogenase/arogenate dehydrogenase family protein [Frankia sp. AgPm24]